MDVGVLMFVTERALPVTELARACEERGLESLWVPEHPVVPRDYETRYPLSSDGKLPRPYTELPDQFAVLAAAAAVTTRLKVGTGICLVPERDPIMLAHQVASLDWLSGGRLLFGIGAGWLREEMDLFTPHFPYRFGFMREAVAAMRTLWTEDAPAFTGKWIRFPAAVCRPRPVQKPHPPVIIGGMGPNALGRVAAWGDGWMPIALSPDGLREARANLDRLAREAGRDPRHISITVMIGAPPGMEDAALDMMPDRATQAAYRDAGADRLVVSMPTRGSDDTRRHLDRLVGS
ncbi:MAG: LLM class F420-dependent oxidoreductase [Candidatus Binatia bacterium]